MSWDAYDVGYEDEMIGRYWGESPEEAISQCKADLSEATRNGFILATPPRDRIGRMIAVKV